MISRYTLPQMGSVWEKQNKLKKWLEVEILSCEAQAELGNIPKKAVAEIKKKASFDVKRVEEIEKRTRHDVIAFLTNVAENVGSSSRYIHYGLTSSDVIDTGLALQMREAIDILIKDTETVLKVLRKQALKYKDTIMVGRTHGIHAEPTTLGLKFLLWFFEMKRNLNRLREAKKVISYGKISGAVGTYSSVDPKVEEYVCKKLNLEAAEVSTQVLQRDRHAQYLTTLAVVASSLDKFATEIRGLQRTDALEVEEPFARGQKGSSAMPHKKNPIICERVSGLARIVRSNAQAALENVALWHERDISHSSVERVIIPDSTILLDYMVNKFVEVVENLVVYPENMKQNLEKTKGLIFSQRVLLELVKKGMTREEAYRVVQKSAMVAWQDKVDFRQQLLKNSKVAATISDKDIEDCFDYSYYLRNIDQVFARLG